MSSTNCDHCGLELRRSFARVTDYIGSNTSIWRCSECFKADKSPQDEPCDPETKCPQCLRLISTKDVLPMTEEQIGNSELPKDSE